MYNDTGESGGSTKVRLSQRNNPERQESQLGYRRKMTLSVTGNRQKIDYLRVQHRSSRYLREMEIQQTEIIDETVRRNEQIVPKGNVRLMLILRA